MQTIYKTFTVDRLEDNLFYHKHQVIFGIDYSSKMFSNKSFFEKIKEIDEKLKLDKKVLGYKTFFDKRGCQDNIWFACDPMPRPQFPEKTYGRKSYFEILSFNHNFTDKASNRVENKLINYYDFKFKFKNKIDADLYYEEYQIKHIAPRLVFFWDYCKGGFHEYINAKNSRWLFTIIDTDCEKCFIRNKYSLNIDGIKEEITKEKLIELGLL